MAGIYIHIPFCKKRCHYCDFYSSVNTLLIDPFLKAVELEIKEQKHFFEPNDGVVNTIYFGGGTPSLFNSEQLNLLINAIKNSFKIGIDPEITMEVNPDDSEVNYLQKIKEIGFNRLSIGIQSFDDRFLHLMNRRHNAIEATNCLDNATKVGFENISIDLIYGIPGMSVKDWENALDIAFKLPIKHLSAYHLGFEEHTVFDNWRRKGKISPLSEELSFKQFELLSKMAKDNGFDHYEISNLAFPNYISKHNTAYWQNIPYLGFGPSAHSYNGDIRKWNVANIKLYIEAIANKKKYWEEEYLTNIEKINEYVMTHLRTSKGLDLLQLKTKFGIELSDQLFEKLKVYIKNDYANIVDNSLKLTIKGWFISDKIISELMVETEK